MKLPTTTQGRDGSPQLSQVSGPKRRVKARLFLKNHAFRRSALIRRTITFISTSVVKTSDSGSALILVLLITALLTTIAVSFLSTSRVEHMATRNFTRQNTASGLAELATQQAMAKIQEGFTINGTGNTTTTVVTSQPGAIRQFVFQNGRITSNSTINLFSGNGSGSLTNMNNLQNPSSNSSATSNQWTITGNASQPLNVYMENVTTTVNGNTQILGRIAYYVDDELTKININAATANRSTLNVADSRTLSLTTLSNNTTNLNNFLNSINGTVSNNSSLATWNYFFRPEQATANGNNTLNLSPSSDLPYLTALPPRDFHMKYTPWGTRRLFINDLPTDLGNATVSVNAIYTALSDPHLRNIYGQTFAEKYTISGANATIGLKQLAANMLQLKDQNTMNLYVSYGGIDGWGNGYYGPLIGSDNLDSDGIPREYLGYAPWWQINEVGISGRLAVEKIGTTISMRNVLQVCIETVAWKMRGSRYTGNRTAQFIVDLDSLTYDVNYTQNGVANTASLGGVWPVSGSSGPFNQFCTNANSTYTQNLAHNDPMDWRDGDAKPSYWTINASRGRNAGGNDVSFSGLMIGFFYRYHIGTLGRNNATGYCPGGIRGGEISMGFSYSASDNITITSISNVKASVKKIRLLANASDNATIRDWVVGGGRDIGDFDISVDQSANGATTTSNSTNIISATERIVTQVTNSSVMRLPLSYNATSSNFTCNATLTTTTTNTTQDLVTINGTASWQTRVTTSSSTNYTTSTFTTNSINTWADPEPVVPPAKSYGKLDPRLRSVSSLSSSRPWPEFSSNATFGWAGFENSTWADTTRGYGRTNFGFWVESAWNWPNPTNSYTNWTKNNMIPGDPWIAGRGWIMPDYFWHQPHDEFAQPWQITWLRRNVGVACWPHYLNASGAEMCFLDSNGNNMFVAPADLGKVVTNYQWRTLRMQLQPSNEVASADGGGNKTTQSLIPDWAMLDVISFGSNSTSIPLNFASYVNLNNKFATANGSATIGRTKGLESLLQSFDNVNGAGVSMIRNPYGLSGNVAVSAHINTTGYDQLGNATIAAGLGNSTTWSQLLARNIGNMTWSPNSVWGSNNTATNRVRKNKGFPANQFVLPSEVTEIRDIADLVSTNSTTFESSTRYTNSPRSIKSNELRLSPFFPGATTCSNFFTIYAYAQAGQLQNKNQPESASNPFVVESEALTKTLVEVEITTPATASAPAQYKVKKLYTQPIPLGQ